MLSQRARQRDGHGSSAVIGFRTQGGVEDPRVFAMWFEYELSYFKVLGKT